MKHFHSGENVEHLQQHLSTLVGAARKAHIPAKLFERICYRQFIVESLEANKLNVCKTAVEIGVHRNTLSRQIDDLDINLRAMRDSKNPHKKPAHSARPYTVEALVRG